MHEHTSIKLKLGTRKGLIKAHLHTNFGWNSLQSAYGQRIREVEHAQEHGSFTHIVLAATGGLAQEATIFYKHLAALLATKWNDEYCKVMGWLRCVLSFSLLRSAIACIRGVRSSTGCRAHSDDEYPEQRQGSSQSRKMREAASCQRRH